MSDIAYWSDEYKREVESFGVCVNYFITLSSNTIPNPQILSQALLDCDIKITRIKEVKKSYGLELRLVKDKTLKADHDSRTKVIDEEYQQLLNQYKDAKSYQQKKQLLNGGSTNNPYDTKGSSMAMSNCILRYHVVFRSLNSMLNVQVKLTMSCLLVQVCYKTRLKSLWQELEHS